MMNQDFYMETAGNHCYTVLIKKYAKEDFIMTESNQTETPKKKMTLQEAMKQKLEEKKAQAAGGKQLGHAAQTTKKMKSQQTKKVSNSRRKMGV